MVKKCICQICTCGRHKCPHNVKPRESFGECIFSEYKNQYTKHRMQPTSSFKPEHIPIASQDPLDDKTIHRIDYVKHPLEKPFKREVEQWKKSEGILESTTNYKIDFSRKPLQPVKMFKPVEYKKNLDKFQGQPSYQDDYKRWGPQARVQPIIQRSQHDGRSEMPFDGNTSYKLDFIGHKVPLTKIIRPSETNYKSKDPFNDNTVYKENYKIYPLERKTLTEKVPWVPNNTPLDDLSSYKKDFTAKDIPRVKSYRPEQKPLHSETPFDETTTHKLDFIPWTSEVRSSIRPKENRYMPDGEMNFDTTTKLDFQGHEKGLIRRSAIRPLENNSFKMGSTPFDGTTRYTSDYKPWTLTERQPIQRRKQVDYVPSGIPFDGQPTYKMDYFEKPIVSVKSAKPLDLGYKSNAPLDSMTEYKKEFIGRKPDVCPANMLITAGSDPRFLFKEKDETGHVWYEFKTSIGEGGVVAAA